MAQLLPVQIAHHTHAAATVLAAADRGLPALVIVRHPRDAVSSMVLYDPNMTVRTALSDYISFYTCIQRARDRIVVAQFVSATTDLGAVIDVINKKFDTSFAAFEHRPENVAQVFGEIERRNKAVWGGLNEYKIGRPSAIRAERKKDCLQIYDSAANQRHRDKAEAIYENFASSADI